MRIACIHLPQFALQCVTRSDAALRGAPVVVVNQRAVQACSRAAWGLGARVGMAVAVARGLAPELVVATVDATLERDITRAAADVLLGLSPVVDLGGRIGAGAQHLAMYCEVPSKTRGASFGERVIEKLEALGLTARVGIADDRFTAWVAASNERSGVAAGASEAVTSVPRGGAAAFLAGRSLSLLAIPPEVQHMLEALGVTTLGEFAALPAPSVARPLEADYQALARGEGGAQLRPYSPDAPIREELALAAMRLSTAIAVLADRVALRLEGRRRGAVRLELVTLGEAGAQAIPISILPGATTADAIATAIDRSGVGDAAAPWRLKLTVTGEALAGEEPALLDETADSMPAIVDTLSLVLSNSGSVDLAGFMLPLPTGGILRGDRPEHRRTRRGKQRRRVDALIQPRLFKI
jgi:hypothetical protein